MPNPHPTTTTSTNKNGLLVGFGVAALLLFLLFIGALIAIAAGEQGGASTAKPAVIPQLTSQQRQMQSDWDSSASDYRSEQCRLWLSQTHFDYFVNSFAQTSAEDQRLITWLLDRNC